MTPIRTARLVLRKFVPADAPRIASLLGDPRVATMMADIALPFDKRPAAQWMKSGWGDLRLCIERDGESIGAVSYHVYIGGQAGIGYWLGHPYWGQGYAFEAASTIVRNALTHDRVQIFTSGHFADNPASGRILTRLGFTPHGRRPLWCPARQELVDSIAYHLTRTTAGFAPKRRSWAGLLGFHPVVNRWTSA